MSGSKLFDTLRDRFGIKSDAALARELEVQPCVISRARADSNLGPTLILSIHEHLGLPVAEIRALATEPAPQQYHDNPAQVCVTEARQ